jgi:hypothetical protein
MPVVRQTISRMDATASILEIAVMSAVNAASKFETVERFVEVMPRSALFKHSSRWVIIVAFERPLPGREGFLIEPSVGYSRQLTFARAEAGHQGKVSRG